MKTLVIYKKLLFFAAFLCLSSVAFSQDTNWTQKNADQWFNSNNWKMGLKLNVHSSVNKVEFAKQYHKNKAVWDKALAFLRDSNLIALKPGKYAIDGQNAYATITEAPSKEFDKSAWESHRNYIDLQYVIKGKEKIGVAALSTATVTAPYDATKDVAHYNAEGQYFTAEPDTFFLFFPEDAHRPNIKVDGYDVVKKLVIKINVVN